MTKKLFLIALALLLGAGVRAATPEADGLAARLTALTATYEGRVGVAFIDLRTDREFSINGRKQFMAASVAKLPVMAAAFHLSDLSQYDLQQRLVFHDEDKLGGSGILQWMRGGTEYTRWNLARMMIVLSDNTATRLLVNDLSLAAVNDYIKNSGLTQTAIVDPTMLNEPPSAVLNKTTPRDMARLLAMISRQQGFSAQSKKEMISFMRNQRYRWGIWRGVPPKTVVADKTGNVDGVLNDVGIVYTKRGNYIISIFTEGFKKQRDARLVINAVSRAAYEEFTGEKVYDPPPRKLARRAKRSRVIAKRRSPRRVVVRHQRKKGRYAQVTGRSPR